jgi:hypothetical protein
VLLVPANCVLQLDSWSVGALAYDVLCGRAPFAEREDISRDEEKFNILNKVRPAAADCLHVMYVCAPCLRAQNLQHHSLM